jgi:hypothetical protein
MGGLAASSQSSQEKQQVPPQQTSPPPAVREQQWALAVHPLAPAGRRQVPWQHSCPAQQSVLALHAPPKATLHCPSAQHCWPLGQLVGVQAHCRCALQTVPVGQATHVAPPVPHSLLAFPSRQKPGVPGPVLAQQPSGQKMASHWQCPSTQRPSSAKMQRMHSSPPVPQASC